MAAQESSHSVPDAGESQDTSALSPEQKETWLAAFLRGENPEPIEASRPEEPIAEYVGGEIRDCRVSVKWLESDPDYDPEDPNAGNYVHLCIEVWALDGTEEDADCWSCDFFHFVSHIQGILPTYLNRWCPFPARVWETAATVPLPNELKGLFDQEERPYANN
jgi:hypothetical protein